MDPKWRVRAAWVLLAVAVVGWPVSALTFAKGEPPVVLGLSWLAIAITAADLLSTQQVHRDQKEGEE